MGAPKPDTALLRLVEGGAPQPPSQEAVLAGVAAGERWAHEALYDLLLPVVGRTLQKILRDASADYDDLVQSSFEHIVRTLTARRAAPIASLSAWAGSIAAHVALDALRRRVRDRRRHEPERSAAPRIEGVPAPSLERQLEARQRLEWLQETLSRMNQDQAQTILLHDVLGHGLSEVAQLMGVTTAAAQRRLSRGHHELLRRAKARGLTGGS